MTDKEMTAIHLRLATIELNIPYSHSLKEKRAVRQRIVKRVQNKFNVSIVESGAQDAHQRLMLSVAFLAHSHAIADSTYEQLLDHIEEMTDAVIVSSGYEVR